MNEQLAALSLPDETWKEVYSKGVKWYVSDFARVYVEPQLCEYTRLRLGVIHTGLQKRPGGILSACKARNGYLEVARKIAGGKRIKERVHRLVGMAFVSGFAPGLTINHIDGDKDNNLPANLEWVSLAENTRHQWGMGLANPVERALTSKQVVYMRRLFRMGVPAHAIDIVAGVSAGYTSKICSGLRRK